MKIFSNYLFFTKDPVAESAIAGNLISTGIAASNSTILKFKIFAGLWAIATLFHMGHSSVFDSQLNYALLTVSALYVIFRPSVTGFVVFITLQIFDAVFRMPFTTNHWLFTAFVNVTILQALIYQVVKQRTFEIKGDVLLDTFAPLVRIEIIILYFFAVFHKLNSGFFSPATSCATDLLQAQHLDSVLPLAPQLMELNAYFTIAIESMIPVMLCFRKTRNLGILAGLFFHGVLSYSSYNAFYDFSSMVFAVLFLFTAPGFTKAIDMTVKSLRSRLSANTKEYTFRKLVFILLSFALSVVVIYLLSKKLDSFRTVHLYFFWTLYSFGFAAFFIRFLLRRQPKSKAVPLSFTLPHWSFAIMLLIVFLNGTSPYLGLKTENSYAMFSNLRTEGGITNHFIIPASAQIFDYQKDVVEILSSSDPGLQELATENKLLVLFEFKNYVAKRKPERIEYLLNGKKEVFLRGERNSGITTAENPYLLAKLMKFRPFSKSEPQPCAH